MSDVNPNMQKLKEPDQGMVGFTYAVPIGAMGLITYDGLEVEVLGEKVKGILSPRHTIWANLVARAALSGPSSAMGLDAARDEFSANGVVIPTLFTRQHITPLWAIPTQRWNKGADKEDLGLRLAQMRFMIQGAGLDDAHRYNPPNIRLPSLVPVNPYCAGAGRVEGCRDLQSVILQCRYVLQEMRDHWAIVLPHDKPWRRKAEDCYLADVTDLVRLESLLLQDDEI